MTLASLYIGLGLYNLPQLCCNFIWQLNSSNTVTFIQYMQFNSFSFKFNNSHGENFNIFVKNEINFTAKI